MKRIALILPCNIERAPYIYYYIDIFRENNIPFEVIYWNKDNKKIQKYNFNTNCYSPKKSIIPSILVQLSFYFYTIKLLKKKQYTHVITFTIIPIIILHRFLEKNYKSNYIYDIRDYSNILKYSKNIFSSSLQKARQVVISSEGFKSWLPKRDYLISHNVRKSLLIDHKDQMVSLPNDNIRILTIGQIRDYNTNFALIKTTANINNISNLLAGYGKVYNLLKKKCNKYHYNNINFLGEYAKDKENEIVLNTSFINAITPIDLQSKFLITNRLYLSCLYRRPIIVSSNTYQAEIVNKFQLGITIQNFDELITQINSYMKNFSEKTFDENCKKFISYIMKDITTFEHEITNSIFN